ncbi:MAG: DUF5754 family protein [Cyanophyceae cyanobacterium]
MIAVEIKPATQKNKKLQAIFYQDGRKIKTIPFGQAGASDFTQHKDKERRDRYDARHEPREDWTDPMTAGTLAKFNLWSEPTLKEGFKKYLKRFNLKRFRGLGK